jgi:hypothetical protein
MAIILLDNNKTLVYVPDCALPEALLDPEAPAIEEEWTEENGEGPALASPVSTLKRAPEPKGVWSKGIQIHSSQGGKNPAKRQKTGP